MNKKGSNLAKCVLGDKNMKTVRICQWSNIQYFK